MEHSEELRLILSQGSDGSSEVSAAQDATNFMQTKKLLLIVWSQWFKSFRLLILQHQIEAFVSMNLKFSLIYIGQNISGIIILDMLDPGYLYSYFGMKMS